MNPLIRVFNDFRVRIPKNVSLVYTNLFDNNLEGCEIFASNGRNLLKNDILKALENNYPYSDFLYRLEQVVVDLKYGIIYNQKRVVDESSLVSSSAQYDSVIFRSRPKRKTTKFVSRNSDFYSPVSILSNNYYHWITDSLPKIIQIMNSFSNIEFIAYRSLPSYAESFFKEFNIKVSYSQKRYVNLDRVIFANSRNPFKPLPSDAKLIKNFAQRFLYSDSNGDENKIGNKIFITRDKSSRYTSLESGVYEAVKKDFIKVRSEELGFIESSKLFGNIDELSAFHGAGLANMVFLKERCTVNEYTTGHYWSPVYLRMAQNLNLKYNLIKVSAIDNPKIIYSTSTVS